MRRAFATPDIDPERPGVATRDRLLDAAGGIFAERGFANATVREICQRAGANIAAVNYHFGDKRGLYGAVFAYAHDCAGGLEQLQTELATLRPRDRLRRFIHGMLERQFDEGRPAWHGKLMARELLEPTGVLDQMVERGIRPKQQILSAIVRDLIGQDADPHVVRRCAAGIIGQCVFLSHARPILERLDPAMRYTKEEIAQFADHITRFSLRGLAAFCQTKSAAAALAG